jgi:hypothetical protein
LFCCSHGVSSGTEGDDPIWRGWCWPGCGRRPLVLLAFLVGRTGSDGTVAGGPRSKDGGCAQGSPHPLGSVLWICNLAGMEGLWLCPGEIPGREATTLVTSWTPSSSLEVTLTYSPSHSFPCARVKVPNLRIGRRWRCSIAPCGRRCLGSVGRGRVAFVLSSVVTLAISLRLVR